MEALHTPALPGIIILAILLVLVPVAAADLADQYYGDGVNFSHAGKYADALVSYDKVVFIRPNHADAWLNRGIALDYLGRYNDAIASYDKVIVTPAIVCRGVVQPWHRVAETRQVCRCDCLV